MFEQTAVSTVLYAFCHKIKLRKVCKEDFETTAKTLVKGKLPVFLFYHHGLWSL